MPSPSDGASEHENLSVSALCFLEIGEQEEELDRGGGFLALDSHQESGRGFSRRW